MIISFKAVNIVGINYLMKFQNSRNKNSSELDDYNLFKTFQLKARASEDLSQLFIPLTVFKLLYAQDAFKLFCQKLPENSNTSLIEVKFLSFNNNTSSYEKFDYRVTFSNDGIIEEVINGNPVMRKISDSPFMSFMPDYIIDWLEIVQIFDLKVNECLSDLIERAQGACKTEYFVEFCVSMIKSLGYPALKSIKADNNTNTVYFKFDGNSHNLNSIPEKVKHLFAISALLYFRSIIPGVTIINNIDHLLNSNQVAKILEFINENNIRNHVQFIIGSSNDYGLLPEQTIELVKQQELVLCKWMND